MKKEDVLNLMTNLPPDLIEEADLDAPAKRRLPKLARTGLIAACLCLALLGTAFAANPESVAQFIDRLTVHIFPDEKAPGYSVTGGAMTKYPLNAFSPALLAASENRDGPVVFDLHFDTWGEVQAFLGEDIPCVWPEDWDTDWFQVVLFHTESEVLWGIDIYSTDLSRQAQIQMKIRTELWQGENASSSMGTLPGGGITQLDSYPMANGATAELIQVTDPETVYADGTPTGFHSQRCAGYFMQDGILYTVTAFYPIPPQESTEAQLKTVLDSFPAN